ncbi:MULTISPECIES: STAS/SEC14 domain-containing protein [Micrococcaceae]|uniref:DUF7793 family protein n=1 Tax=Micrococcaceae TaxID=1268 RepID=UPI001CC34330|nr:MULTISPECIES: STAS/SEC14 domain-containing protein [Micrococcaceae]BCW64988.1 hypothetical protein StoSoilB22_39610 [Arthrobacter sp. StoSoilB22]
MAEANHVDYTLQLEPDNVLSLAWAPGARIEAENARAAVDAVNEFAAGNRYPLLVRMAKTSHLSRAARDVFVEPCAASRIALLGENAVDRMLVDYQLAAQPAPCPTRFFSSEAEAMAWLVEPEQQTADRNATAQHAMDQRKGGSGSLGGAAP